MKLKKAMKKVKITDLCNIQVGKTPFRANSSFWGEGFPWLSIADMNQGIDIEKTKESITSKAIDECNCKIVPKDTVLYSFKLSIGKIGITKIPLYTNEAIAAFLIKDPKSIKSKYLYYALKSADYSINSNKAVMGKTLNKALLEKFEIPIASIVKQEEIIESLDKITNIVKNRQQTIELLDDYLKSIFLDMFGDPVLNSENWELKKFGEIGTLDRGVSKYRPRNAPELLGGTHPLIQTGDVSNAGLFINDYTSTYSDFGLKQSKKWPKGTLCITIAANIAKTGILDLEACFPDSVVGFIPEPTLTNTIFIHFWMSFFQKILEANAPESAQKNINLAILRKLDVINPSIELQNKFADIVLKTEEVRNKMNQQESELENQFQALMQRYFN